MYRKKKVILYILYMKLLRNFTEVEARLTQPTRRILISSNRQQSAELIHHQTIDTRANQSINRALGWNRAEDNIEQNLPETELWANTDRKKELCQREDLWAKVLSTWAMCICTNVHMYVYVCWASLGSDSVPLLLCTYAHTVRYSTWQRAYVILTFHSFLCVHKPFNWLMQLYLICRQKPR